MYVYALGKECLSRWLPFDITCSIAQANRTLALKAFSGHSLSAVKVSTLQAYVT